MKNATDCNGPQELQDLHGTQGSAFVERDTRETVPCLIAGGNRELMMSLGADARRLALEFGVG